MKKGLIIGTVILVIGLGIGYYFWDKNTKEKTYSSQLSTLLDEIELSTSESAIIGATYQEYWGEIIDRSIPTSTMSEALNISEDEIEPFLNYSNTAHFSTYGGNSPRGLEQGNFDTMLAIVKLAKSEDTAITLKNYDSITNKLTNLKNPPKKFESDYETVLDLYEIYNSFVSLSTQPVGSYVEYSKNINSTYESLQSKIKTTKIQIQ
ncbi:hypothetical protein KQ41_20060 [Lysinibacillus fusiformis]|uniref:hypothetical protein n=1 Tax=Lysinibacillus fusiformis TaxID=28031 RepID=UPI000502E802|nr:hypothetical protein [Lysinibacillus fusiformis]KGA81104.1 hypothetical protein KQ41_20060 [Lysinibacillus fusiformis]